MSQGSLASETGAIPIASSLAKLKVMIFTIEVDDNAKDMVIAFTSALKMMFHGVRVEISDNDTSGHDDVSTRDLLVNNIFRDDMFTSNDLLVRLRQTIANAISQGDADRIDLTHANEWYWLYAGLLDAGFLETRSNRENAVTDIGFVRQIALWFPDLLDVNNKKKIRQICNGMSTERTKWTMNGKLISLVDIEANKRRLTAMKETKVSRIVSVAYQGLYVPLMKLKADWI